MNLGLEENLFEFSTTWSTSGTLLGTILWVSGFNCICILFLYRMLSSLCGCFRLSRPINLFHRFCAVTKKIQPRNLSEVRYRVKNDIVLYMYERASFFRWIGIACLSQCVFWTTMGHFIYFELRAGDWFPADNNSSASRNRQGKQLASWKIRTGMAVFAVGSGLFFVALGSLFASRCVNRLVLLEGGNSVKFSTYTPLGGTKSFIANLSDISASGSRLGGASQIPVKVKGHRFYYLIDKQGDMLQPSVFDNTVGVKRFEV